jgi:hypothetical protein
MIYPFALAAAHLAGAAAAVETNPLEQLNKLQPAAERVFCSAGVADAPPHRPGVQCEIEFNRQAATLGFGEHN